MGTENYDDPFPEIISHGGFTEAETQRIIELESLMAAFELGGADGGPVLLAMSQVQAARLLEVLKHATDHGCPESLRSLWSWLEGVVMPALKYRLEEGNGN